MTKALYTAQAHVTGGRADGHGRTSDGRLDVDLRQPKELGGDGEGTNPEQLFAIGYAACFAPAGPGRAAQASCEADDAAIDAKVMLIPPATAAFKLGVELDISLPSIADASRPPTWSRRRIRCAPTPTPPAATSTWRWSSTAPDCDTRRAMGAPSSRSAPIARRAFSRTMAGSGGQRVEDRDQFLLLVVQVRLQLRGEPVDLGHEHAGVGPPRRTTGPGARSGAGRPSRARGAAVP